MTYLQHHCIKGQKWGVRRYQNEDGTLTEEGKKRLVKQKKILKDVGITAAATFVTIAGIKAIGPASDWLYNHRHQSEKGKDYLDDFMDFVIVDKNGNRASEDVLDKLK